MLIHFQVSEGVPAGSWLTTCGHLELTVAPIGSVEACALCSKEGCIAVVHALREQGSLNHRVTLTAQGALLHRGAKIEGIITMRPEADGRLGTCCAAPEAWCSPELLAGVRDLGELASSEILASLTAGRGADGDILEIDDEESF